jgi:two-component system response regulator NreC
MRGGLRLVGQEIRVVIAEEHDTMRRSLRRLLDDEQGIDVVAEAADLAGATDQVRRRRPRVLVLDLRLPDGSTIEAILRLREQSPRTAVVVVTMQHSRVMATRALDAGALGFVLKDTADEELVEAVRRAARGEPFASPRLQVTVDAVRTPDR